MGERGGLIFGRVHVHPPIYLSVSINKEKNKKKKSKRKSQKKKKKRSNRTVYRHVHDAACCMPGYGHAWMHVLHGEEEEEQQQRETEIDNHTHSKTPNDAFGWVTIIIHIFILYVIYSRSIITTYFKCIEYSFTLPYTIYYIALYDIILY